MDERRVSFLSGAPRRVLIALGLAIYSAAFGEIFVRVVDPQPLIPRYVTTAPWGVRGNIPGAQYWHTTQEVRVQYRINSQGMRADHEFAYAKPFGECRIALFGDSFFMGYELDLADTFATQLEQRLRDDGYQVELLNFSVSGFGTAEMLRTYEAFGRRFDPDVVLFEWHATDFDDNLRSNLYRLDHGTIVPARQTYLPAADLQAALTGFGVYRFIADNSQLYSAIREKAAASVKRMLLDVRERMASRFEAAAPGDADETDVANQSDGAPAIGPSHAKTALSGALLTYANRMMSDEGRSFLVVDVPRRVTRTSFLSTVESLPAADRAGVPIVSPIADFRRVANPDLKLYYEKGHGHFTPAAIRILVDITAPRVEEAPRLGRCRHQGQLRASVTK